MANYKTGAQRYNDRMEKIFEKSKELNEKYHGKDSFGSSKHIGKALDKAKKEEKRYIPAPMPKNYHSMNHSERVEYYKHHKGATGSTKVNPKTGKYYDTY